MSIKIKDYGQSQKEIANLNTEKLTTEQMQKLYQVIGFAAPFVMVRRISDNIKGSLEFGHSPRLYFNFKSE